MIILAIETSCDDTSVAILKITGDKTPNFKVLSNIVSSQVEIHKKWGGVYPSLAKREHEKNLPLVLDESLKKAKLSENPEKIDLIAVTNGPGLEPCLWVGINFAKNLAKKSKTPVASVNHIEAHILANFLHGNKKIIFPVKVLFTNRQEKSRI
jgi:N6-L-threonylcarbamoyladenine synthase